MKRWLGDIRLLPIVLIAAGCLFALKTVGLIFEGGYTLGQRLGSSDSLVVTTVPGTQVAELRSPSVPLVAPGQTGGQKLSWMQEMFSYPGGDITGSVAAKPKEEGAKDGEAKRGGFKKEPLPIPPESRAANGTVIALDQTRSSSVSERALLERLQERRQELEARARELELRESLVKAAEKKLETQNVASKAEEPAAEGAQSPRKDKDDAADARLKSVVKIYETMKPKDAAKIFDRLDPKVLLEVASHIKPQRMSEILAQMSPEAAERLTVELASRNPVDRSVNPASLPKIEGRPGG